MGVHFSGCRAQRKLAEWNNFRECGRLNSQHRLDAGEEALESRGLLARFPVFGALRIRGQLIRNVSRWSG